MRGEWGEWLKNGETGGYGGNDDWVGGGGYAGGGLEGRVALREPCRWEIRPLGRGEAERSTGRGGQGVGERIEGR